MQRVLFFVFVMAGAFFSSGCYAAHCYGGAYPIRGKPVYAGAYARHGRPINDRYYGGAYPIRGRRIDDRHSHHGAYPIHGRRIR